LRNNYNRMVARSLQALVLALFFTLAVGSASAQTYQVVHSETAAVTNNLTRTVATIQDGSNPHNRFFMSRVVKTVPAQALRGTILLLPPLGSGFQNYETTPDNDYDNSFVGFFANRGFDVRRYSQRTQGIAAGSCESGSIDCSIMADWGMQTILN